MLALILIISCVSLVVAVFAVTAGKRRLRFRGHHVVFGKDGGEANVTLDSNIEWEINIKE